MMQGSLAMRLRVLRAERGLSLTEAAERAGIQRQTLALLERGERHPHDPTLAKIAKGYGVPVEDLLEEPVPLGEAPEGEPGSVHHVRMPHDSIEVSDEVKADVRLEKVRQILAARDAGNIAAVDADKAIQRQYTAA
jgi:transcriptional regulator with XRE-family HTH domain